LTARESFIPILLEIEFSGISQDSSSTQSLNAASPISSTDAGIEMLFNDRHAESAYSQILLNLDPSAKTTCFGTITFSSRPKYLTIFGPFASEAYYPQQ
jgi:hypothetical protein